MPDPKRNTRTGIFAETKLTIEGKEEFIKLNALVDNEKVSTGNPEEIKKFLAIEVQKISPNPAMILHNTHTIFSYVDPNALKDFDYGNVLVELHIPYCIDVPNDYEIEVLLSKELGTKALVIPSKIWTQKARDNELKLGSDDTDFYADDKVLYFNNSRIIGPKFPLDPTEGWEPNYTGVNIEKIKDANGRFRFSHLFVQFDLPVKSEDLENRETSEIIVKNIQDITLQAVNKFIDAYRFITKQEQLTRLGETSINLIYFVNLNKGFALSRINIASAVMNRSKNEIEKISDMLKSGTTPELYDLLLLDSQNSFNSRNYALAVVQSFQALEIYLENLLINLLQKNGMNEVDASLFLTSDNNWRTKTRLKEVLKTALGFTLQEKDSSLWDKWCNTYDTVRNKVIHKGKDATNSEVKSALENNIAVIEFLKGN